MRRALTGILLFVTAWSISIGAAMSGTPEEAYIRSRDRFIRAFERGDLGEAGAPERALRVLEAQLRALVGPFRVAGFPESGLLNRQTLDRRHDGFNQVDGLIFQAPQERLFVTTRALLQQDLEGQGALPKGLKALSGCEDFYRRVFSWDLAYQKFAEWPLEARGGFERLRAVLTSTAQDLGPFVPQTLVIFAVKGHRIVLHESQVPVEQIDLCKGLWDEAAAKSSEALTRYRTSQGADRQAWEAHRRLDREGFEVYRDCFREKINGSRNVSRLKEHAQSIVDRLREGL